MPLFDTSLIRRQDAQDVARIAGPGQRELLAAAVYVAAYLLLAWLSFVRPKLAPAITPWSPDAGLTLAFLLYYGLRGVPATFVAAFLSLVLVHVHPAPAMQLALAALWVALGYGALSLLLRRAQVGLTLMTTIDAARLAGSCAIGTLVIAAGYVGFFVSTGRVSGSDALEGIARYWVGDLNGVLALTPLLMRLDDWRQQWREVRARRGEVLAQAALLALTTFGIFLLPAADQLRFFYLLFVPVVWIALRWTWSGALLAVLGIQAGLLVVAETRIPTARFIDLQFLMLTLTLTGLMLGAVVAERAAALRRMAVREAEQRALLAMAPDAVLDVDARGRIRVANAAALRLFGDRAEARHETPVTTLLPGLELESPEGRATLAGRRGDGEEFPAEVAWARLDPPANAGILVIVRDASDRRRAEMQLRERDAALARAMRFAVAGELASALAHELNQPITALVSYLRASEILSGHAAGDDERLKSTLGKAAVEAMRASEVLRRLRDFYQGGHQKQEFVHLPTLCNEVASAFQDRVRSLDAALTVDIDPEIPLMQVDGTQLQVVLHNLIGNALDAVAQRPPGRRQVVVRGSHSAGTVVLRIEDSGPGIAAEVARELFEPFVTSKADGMGLGLAISRSLIRARGGELSLAESGELSGAAFVVRIPLHAPAEAIVL